MSDLEPIELEFLINSPELLAELQAASSGMKSHDEVVEKVVQKYDELQKKNTEAGRAAGESKSKFGDLGAELLKTGGNIDKIGEVIADFAAETAQSSINVGTLSKAKELWNIVTQRVAASLGITTAAAGALTATVTLGLSVAIIALVAVYKNWKERNDEAEEGQIKLRESIAQTASESIASFMAMRAEWNSLGDDLQAKQKFVEDNQQAFSRLGVAVDDVGSAENIFKRQAAAMVESLLERARAMAAMQLAAEELKKSLQVDFQVKSREETYKKTMFGGIDRFMNEKVGGALGIVNTADDAKRYEQNAQKFVAQKVKADAHANQILKRANIKQHEENRKEEKTQLEKDAEVYKARTGKKAYDLLIQNENSRLSQYKKGSKQWADAYQQRAVLIAEKQHEQEEAEKKASTKAASAAEKARKKQDAENRKAENDLRRHVEQQKKFLEKLANEENSAKNSTTSDTTEEAKIKSKYEQMAKEAEQLGMAKNVLNRINAVKDQRLGEARYEDDTQSLLKHLGNMKEIYDAFEAYRSKVGIGEAEKRYSEELGDYKTFMARLQSEIDKVSAKQNLSASENKRLKELQELQAKAESDSKAAEDNKYAQALEATATFEERKAAITEQYLEQKLLLEKRYNGAYLQEKLELLKKERDASIKSAADEVLQKMQAFGDLSDGLMTDTNGEIRRSIQSLEEFLSVTENITDEEKESVRQKIQYLNKIKGTTDTQLQLNKLAGERAKLEKELAEGAAKTAEQYAKIKERIARIKEEERDIKLRSWANYAQEASGYFFEMSDAFRGTNDELADGLELLGQIADLAAKVVDTIADVFKNIGSGNYIGAISGIVSLLIKAISFVINRRKKQLEQERKVQEELNNYNKQIFQSGLDYNAMLRDRLKTEISINDAYQSRVDAIKEEMAANAKNKESMMADYKATLQRLLGSQTLINEYSKKTGKWRAIFGPEWIKSSKTKLVQEFSSVSEALGLGHYETKNSGFLGLKKTKVWVQDNLSGMSVEELMDKIDKLNASRPLTGDAKEAYEQLKKLRDEYGSIEAAQRELEKQYKDALTGTTASALADSIREGILSGKKSFADFADDIEGFLRQGIIAGMSAKVIEPQIQRLQDKLADFLGDGILSEDEKTQFQQMYLKIAGEAQEYLNLINQSGVNVVGSLNSANSLQGALRAASQESIDLLAGQTGGMRMAQLETNQLLRQGSAQQLEAASKMIAVQIDIEYNTRRTADNTERIGENTEKIDRTLKTQYNDLKAAGII